MALTNERLPHLSILVSLVPPFGVSYSRKPVKLVQKLHELVLGSHRSWVQEEPHEVFNILALHWSELQTLGRWPALCLDVLLDKAIGKQRSMYLARKVVRLLID